MRNNKSISIFVLIAAAFACTVAAQRDVSDTKLMRLKGRVRSLVTTSKPISGYAEWVLKDKTKHQTTYQFDKEGNLTESLYEGATRSKLVHSSIDGHKKFRTIQREAPESNLPRFTGRADKGEPVEPGEQPADPDKRFDFKYVYEITPGGRIVIERQYTNTGEVFRKRTFKYDEAGVLIYEKEEGSVAVTTYWFKYDDKNNVVEVAETRDIKGPGTDSTERITYTEVKFDAEGNWTQRIHTLRRSRCTAAI